MSKKQGMLRVPFDLVHPYPQWRGLLDYASPHGIGVEWRDNYEFDATLRLEGFERGRSAAHAIWRDIQTELRYPMFLTFLEEILKQKTVSGGLVYGKWTFAKRGTNYSIRMVLP